MGHVHGDHLRRRVDEEEPVGVVTILRWLRSQTSILEELTHFALSAVLDTVRGEIPVRCVLQTKCSR